MAAPLGSGWGGSCAPSSANSPTVTLNKLGPGRAPLSEDFCREGRSSRTAGVMGDGHGGGNPGPSAAEKGPAPLAVLLTHRPTGHNEHSAALFFSFSLLLF